MAEFINSHGHSIAILFLLALNIAQGIKFNKLKKDNDLK